VSYAARAALAGLRARPGRAALTAAGVAAASLMLGVALSLAFALSTGFDRAADRADLPTVLARFAPLDRREIDRRVRALPNLEAASYRSEFTDVPLRSGAQRLSKGVVHVVAGGRRGYAIVAGRDVRGARDVVIERGLARAWKIGPGSRLFVGDLNGASRVVGVAVSPDNVAYPLAKTARVYLSGPALAAAYGNGARYRVNVALLWARDPGRADVLLSGARQSAYGVRDLRFVTRDGVRALIDQAAGIVVALLVAFAVITAVLAGVLLAAGARSDVQRRLGAIGVRRAIGLAPGPVVATHALEGALVAAPAAAFALALGALLARAPIDRLLAALNELTPPFGVQLALLGAAWAGVVALVAASAALPAWRAARRRPAALLRGGDVTPAGRRGAAGAGLFTLGARFAAARRARFATVVTVLGLAAGVVLLMLSLAGLLQRLRDDPATLGKRYQLTARLPAEQAKAAAAIRGVAAAAARYEVPATSSFVLGSPLKLVSFPGDHTRFEAPPLATGRRVREPGEAEIGVGLADRLGLRAGATLAVQVASGAEVRFRVVGVVRALQDEGRVAYVQPARLEAAGVRLAGPMALRLEPGADRSVVRRGLAALGATPQPVGGAAGGNQQFLGILAALLRLVAGTVGLVCLYALVQALALTVRERRRAVATLRAAGADAAGLRRLLGGATAAVLVPAAVVAVLLEVVVLAPLTARLAAGYVSLPLAAGAGSVGVLVVGLAGLGLCATWLTGRGLVREPIIVGLREGEG